MRRGDGQRAPATRDPVEQLRHVADGKPFENLSWRLLWLLVDGVEVERRQLGAGDRLKLTSKMDVIYVESGQLRAESGKGKSAASAPKPPPVGRTGGGGARRSIVAGAAVKAVPTSTEDPWEYLHANQVDAGDTYVADDLTSVRIFFKPKKRKDSSGSRWGWLCERSSVARGALLKNPASKKSAEVVLLSSRDLVEYLPSLTELLAQAMTKGDQPDDTHSLSVCLVRYDRQIGDTSRPGLAEVGKLKVVVVGSIDQLETQIIQRKKDQDYVFVDPYDRATDLGAMQVHSRTTRARVLDSGTPIDVNPNYPGCTLPADEWDRMMRQVHSLVRVSRSFGLSPDPEDQEDLDPQASKESDKLQFRAVVLDSRTARYESGPNSDPSLLRSADEPLRPPVTSVAPLNFGPTTRLHLNLLRLKKAWEQAPLFEDVCQVLDEPNIPRSGEQQGFWRAQGFFERWVRDLRFRRVGVALGGGGATGFSHVALIRELRQRNIPIDLVSGTSFGALVGAYYCSQGLDGLQILVEQALLYTGVISLTILNSAVLEHLVNLSVEYRPMWELPIPFLAVATDVQRGEQAIFPGPLAANPSVGFAVRASGALPGFFAPAIAGTTRPVRYVDGGAVSIVPAEALILSGADVIIGSNAFPFRKNDGTYGTSPLLRGLMPPPFNRWLAQCFDELNPGNRMTDAARSLALSLTPAMQYELGLATAVYEHKRTDIKYWEFHRAPWVLAAATQDLATSGALPAAINAVRLLNLATP